MFILGTFIGIYAYSIFFLGIFGLLTKTAIFTVTILWFLILLFFERRVLISVFQKVVSNQFSFRKNLKSTLAIFAALIIIQALVNLIGALGPELAFDALWYHLSLPKLYLLHAAVYHIPGWLLYYSDMPKLGEMVYTGALALGNEITAKLVHFAFGMLVSIALYRFSRRFFSPLISFMVVSIFYANLVVDWESITAYIDLIRTFFEVLALWSFILWSEKESWKWLMVSALMMGLAITTKVLAIGSLLVFLVLIVVVLFSKNGLNKFDSWVKVFLSMFVYTFIALVVPLPWFIFSYIHTGNPVYPFFTYAYEVNASSPNLLQFFSDIWNLFMHSADPISPMYLIFLPLLFVTFSKFGKEIKLLVWYSGLSILLWYFTPQTGGGRFIVPYLPVFSFVCGAIYSEILKKNRKEWKYISAVLLMVIISVSCISIGYRFIANSRFIPVIIGKETKSQFLESHLNFSFGDFYDSDTYFAEHIKSSDAVLLYGFHNLYYVDFPFIDSSWAQKGDSFDYIAVQNALLPAKFKNWQLIYKNDKTLVQLYEPPKGACREICHY